MMKTNLDLEEIRFIAHALGVPLLDCIISDKKFKRVLPKEFSRNYYTAPSTSDIKSMIKKGLLIGRVQFGQDVFHCTQKAIDLFRLDYQTLVPYVQKKKRGVDYYLTQINSYCFYQGYTYTPNCIMKAYCEDYSKGFYVSFTMKRAIESLEYSIKQLKKEIMNDLINELTEDVVKAKAKLRAAEKLLNIAITADLMEFITWEQLEGELRELNHRNPIDNPVVCSSDYTYGDNVEIKINIFPCRISKNGLLSVGSTCESKYCEVARGTKLKIFKNRISYFDFISKEL